MSARENLNVERRMKKEKRLEKIQSQAQSLAILQRIIDAGFSIRHLGDGHLLIAAADGHMVHFFPGKKRWERYWQITGEGEESLMAELRYPLVEETRKRGAEISKTNIEKGPSLNEKIRDLLLKR